MKKGISVWSFPDGTPLKEIFRQAKAAGFDGVEVAMGFAGEITPDTADAGLQEVKRQAQEAGIELYSVAASVYWTVSLTAEDPVQREQAKACVKRQLEIARVLGCDTILVLPGHTGADIAPELGVVDYETAYARAIEAAKELAPFAEQAGVVIGMENVWNKFLLSPLEARAYLETVDSPFVQFYFDVGNVLYNSYPEHWIRILGGRIRKVHFKDFKRSIGNINGFCDLFAGDVDFGAVKRALDSVGYDDWVTAEVSAYREDNMIMLKHTSAAMDVILGRDSEC